MDKSIETESRAGSGRKEWGLAANRSGVSFWGEEYILKLNCEWLDNSVNVLKTIELCSMSK